jgi:large subunit ribosomal protein L19
MENLMKSVEAKYLKKDMPKFCIGDTVDVQMKIVEEGKSRIQTFEGIVIAKAGSGVRETFTVRKISYGEGVEMVFPLHSPFIDKVKVVKKGDVKRAKLYYLKRKVGKETRVDEKIEHAAGPGATAAAPAAAPAQEAAAPRKEAA